jgi:cation diffusion facilitator family transporter
VEAALLFGLAGGVGWEAVQRLIAGTTARVEVTPLVIGVLVLALLIDGTRWRTLNIVAKNTGSEALAGAAAHFGTDFVSTFAALMAMVAVLMGFPKADAIAALMVAGFAAVSGFHLLRDTLATLTDKAPPGVTERVQAAVETIPGVSEIDWLKFRQSGGRLHGEVGVKVSRTLPLERAAEIKAQIVRAIQQLEPFAEITVTANPVEINEETATETVMVIAARMRMPVHRVKVQRVAERLCIALDMEVAGDLSLMAAHDQASRLEDALKAAFGPGTEVDTHIEPLEPEDPDAVIASPEVHEQLRAALAAAAGSGPVSDVHSVRARQTDDGLVVVYHCRVDPALSVGDVHRAVDRMDRAIRTSWPQVSRIAGHAEPLR